MVPLASLSLATSRARLALHAGTRGHAPGTVDSLLELGDNLRAIIEEDRLKPHFQPILDLGTGAVHAFEGLIRGPSDTLLHSPASLFKVAGLTNQLFALEAACCRAQIRAYAASGLTQKLFLNLSPGSLATAAQSSLVPLDRLEALGVPPGRIVIELTEALPIHDLGVLIKAIALFRRLGFAIALDDLGEGFSSLRLWSELRPEYVKVDMHFIQGVSRDPVKHQFLKSLCDIAAKTGAKVVAEGLELDADLAVVQELGLDYGQGYLLGRPAQVPCAGPAFRLRREVRPTGTGWLTDARATAARLLMELAPLDPETPTWKVEKRFQEDRNLQSLPVVKAVSRWASSTATSSSETPRNPVLLGIPCGDTRDMKTP